ncbi:unnamed protein product [Urochloa humidicola]
MTLMLVGTMEYGRFYQEFHGKPREEDDGWGRTSSDLASQEESSSAPSLESRPTEDSSERAPAAARPWRAPQFPLTVEEEGGRFEMTNGPCRRVKSSFSTAVTLC